MAVSNRDYVGRALEQLNEGLKPFFERELRSSYGDGWEEHARARLTEKQGSWASSWDVTAMLSVMMSPYEPVFRRRFARADLDVLRECRQIRNDWAHFDTFTLEHTCRALDSILHLLRHVGASREARRVQRLRQQLDEQHERERQEQEATPLTKGMGRAGGPREFVERFLENYLGTPRSLAPFGGRQAELTALDRWLEAVSAPFGLLVAPAGRGKSALVSQWVSRLAQTRRAEVVFIPISLRFHLTERSAMLRLLGGRLAHLTQPDVEQPDDPDGWAAEIQMMLRRDRPALAPPLVVVLDGLDEAMGWEIGRDLILPKALGRGVRVLVTARALAGCDVDGWRERLGWELARTQVFDLPALDLAGVGEVLRSLGPTAGVIAAQEGIQHELLRLSEGDPLLVRLYVDALPKSAGNVTPLTAASLAQLPPGLEGYMQRWWEEQHDLWGTASPMRERTVRVVLNLLACALGPLMADDFLELAKPEELDSLLLGEAIRSLARLIVGDGSVQGYTFSHARLGHYRADQLRPRERTAWEQRFLDYGAQTLLQLQDGFLAPAAAPAYCLRYYRTLLGAAGADLTRVSGLLSEPWLRAWEALDSTYDGFLADVRAIWSEADAALLAREGNTLLAITVQCRCLLTWTSINSLGANIPSELFIELVQTSVWSHTEAIARIARIPDEETQAKHLTALAPYLREDILDLALSRVRNRMHQPLPRVQALLALASRLPDVDQPGVWREALVLAPEIPDSIDRAEQLFALVQHLPGEVDLDMALAEAIGSYASAGQMSIYEVLEYHLESKGERRVRWLLDHVPECMLGDVIEMLTKNPSVYVDPWGWLASILHRLPASALSLLCNFLLQTIGNTPSDEHDSSNEEASTNPPPASLLHDVLPLLSEVDRELVIEAQLEVLNTADRTDELVPVLRPWCTPEQGERIDTFVQKRPRSQSNLRLAVESLARPINDAVIDGRPVSGRPIQQILIRARVLAQPAEGEMHTHRQNDVAALYAAALALPHAADRTQGLLAIAPLLPATERPSASRLALAAIAVIPPLTAELKAQYLQIARRSRRALFNIADEDVVVILAERDQGYRPRALVAAASYLPPQERRAPLLEAHSLLQTRCPDEIWVWGSEGLIRQLLDVDCLDEALDLLQLLPPDREEEADSIAAAIRVITETLAERGELARVLPRLVSSTQRIGNRTDKVSALFTLAQAAPTQARRAILQAAGRAASAIDDGPERVDLLLHLARHISEDSREPLLRALLGQIELLPTKLPDRGDHVREEAVDDLVPILSDPLLAEAHAAILNMCSEDLEVEVLERLAPLLPLRELRAIALVRAPFDDDHEGSWLQTLVRRLVAEEGEPSVRDLIDSLSEAGDRAWLLSLLAVSLDHPHAGVVLVEALDAIAELEEANSAPAAFLRTGRLRAIETLCSSLPVEHLHLVARHILSLLAEEKLDTEAAFVLQTIAMALPPGDCASALEMIRTADDDSVVGIGLTALILHLPASLFDDALGIARCLNDDYRRCQALIAVADRLAGDAREELLLEALQALRNPTHGWSLDSNASEAPLTEPQSEVARTLLSLIQVLPPARYGDVLEVARALEPDAIRANALAVLAPHLVPKHSSKLLDAARAIVAEDARVKALVALAFVFPQPLGDEVLLDAVDIDDPVCRIWALSVLGLAPGLSRTSQEEAIKAALALLPALNAGEAQAAGVRSLAVHAADEAHTQKILCAVQQIAALKWRGYALAGVLAYLSLESHLELVDEALLLCQDYLRHRWRVIALDEIVSSLSELPRTARIPRWNRALTSRRTLSRSALLADLSLLIPMLEALGGQDAAAALAEAVLEQGRWFP